jgi:NADPH-dependent 2,4-dienoyl-CoA reductase/sulfur reductase-like enzyme
VAAGDVARWPNPLFDGELMRVEHWTNAAEQGMHAARSLLAAAADADPAPYAAVPFVWSDQYDVKIQSAGRFSGDDRMEIVHGTPESGRFVAVFERSGRLSGVLGFAEPRRVMQYRRMIAERAPFSAALEFAAAAGV